jgi:hypothetical protein
MQAEADMAHGNAGWRRRLYPQPGRQVQFRIKAAVAMKADGFRNVINEKGRQRC